LVPPPHHASPFPYTTLFRSARPRALEAPLQRRLRGHAVAGLCSRAGVPGRGAASRRSTGASQGRARRRPEAAPAQALVAGAAREIGKSTRLNSSHVKISYAV